MTGKDLINTKYAPEGLFYISQVAKRAKAYHALTPYPWFGFSDWKTEVEAQCLSVCPSRELLLSVERVGYLAKNWIS
jgi:hypothetical protein